MSERTVRVSLTAQVTGYLQGMEKARKATADAGTAAEKAAREIEAQKQAMESAGRGLMAVGVVAVAATALSVKAAIGWQSAWTGVEKVIDGTPAELKKVEEGLRSLTKVLPASHDEIAAVAEAAGRLGIQAGSVTDFTRVMIDLGEATNITAEAAATDLARFMNVMGTSTDMVSNLGSAVVDLGNNFATSESEIVAMAMRLTGAGKQIGLTEGEVLGLAAALSAVGIEAEAGGSAISKVMIDIASSVEEGGDRLSQFADIAGVSAKDFTDQWKKDPGAALALFVEGLANAETQGASTLGMLEDLGITEVRMRDALLRSASASDDFSAAMGRGNKAFEENTALAAEAEKRYATVESQLGIMTNRVTDAAISFGQVFLPAVSAAAEGIGSMADALGALSPEVQGVIAASALLGGAVALAGGVFLLALPKIAAFQVSLGILATSSMPAVAASATGMMVATNRATAAMAASARFLTGPWGLALAASAVAVGVFVTYLDSLKDSAAEVENSMKTAKDAADIFNSIGEGRNVTAFADVKAQLKDLPTLLQESADQSSNLWSRLGGRESFGALQALRDIGVELARTAGTDLPEAQRQFSLLADETDGTEQSLWRLISSMPAYKDALIQQATALDIDANSSNEAANKTALLKLAQEDATPVALTAAEAYLETADKAASLDDELKTLIDSMNEANGVAQDAVSSNANYQGALEDSRKKVEELVEANGIQSDALDENTAKGSENAAMLADLARKSQDAAQAALEAGGSMDDYKGSLEGGRKSIYDTALALTGSADAAQKLTDNIDAMPPEREIKIIADTANALRDFNNLIAGMNGRTVHIATGAGGSGGMTRADGGEIYGIGGPRQDNIPIMASAGEHMFDAEDVKAMGGQAAVYNFRAGLHSRQSGYADGGGVGRYASPVQYVSAPQMSYSQGTSAAPQFNVVVQSRGGVDLLKYVDVQITSADKNAARRVKMGVQ